MQNFIGIVFIGVLIYFVAIYPVISLSVIGLFLIFYFIKNIQNYNVLSKNKDKYYQLTKDITTAIKKHLKSSSSLREDYYWNETISGVRIIAWVQDKTTTIQIRVIDSVSYEYSLDFTNNKFKFYHTIFKLNSEHKTIELDTFDDKIEIILLDTLNKSLEFLSNKIEENDDKTKQKKEEYSCIIDNLASSIKVKNEIHPKRKQNSLIEAIEKQDIDLIKSFIKNGTDINEQNKDGNNALMIAVMTDKNTNNQFSIHKQHEIIKYLLENGADAFHKNNYNYNIFEIMKHKSHYAEIQKIVEQYHHKPIQESREKFEKNTITVQPNFIEYTESENKQEFLANVEILEKKLDVETKKSEKLLDKVNLQNKSIIKLEDELLNKANLEQKLDVETKRAENLLDKVNLQNKSINQLEEVQEAAKQHLSSEITSLNQQLANQQAEINLANNKLSVTQEEAEKKIQELLLKIESLEKIAETEKKQPSKPTPLTQSFIERSLVKNDGIIVKRDSLDDF